MKMQWETGTIRRRVLVKLLMCWFACCGFSKGKFLWNPLPDGIRENRIRRVGVMGGSDQALFAVTDRAVYRAHDARSVFQNVLTFPTGEQRTYSMDISDGGVLVATAQGIWESMDRGDHWKRIFNPANALYRRCYGVFQSGGTIYAGTAQGLFRRNVEENTWYRHKGELGNKPVYEIIGSDEGVVIAAETGVYFEKSQSHRVAKSHGEDKTGFANDASRLTKILSFTGRESDDDVFTDTSTATDTAFDNRFIRAMALDGNHLWVVAKNGIWDIDLAQQKNQPVPSDGIPLNEVEDIEFLISCPTSQGRRAPDLFPENPKIPETEPAIFKINNDADHDCRPVRIPFIATRQGVFVFLNDQWTSFYQGLSTTQVEDLCATEEGTMFAATSRGLFQLKENPAAALDYRSARQRFADEPTIREVQEMVIRYADVGKEKIDGWKQQARWRAFVPSLSLDLDRDASDLYHWNTGASPDELQKGKEMVDWGISLRWDLADVVWSSDQTSIDSRSKLMVELRDDLLNQATRMYFERRRLQMELLNIPKTDATRWQNEMRVDELTAGLDALTGGKFSDLMPNAK